VGLEATHVKEMKGGALYFEFRVIDGLGNNSEVQYVFVGGYIGGIAKCLDTLQETESIKFTMWLYLAFPEYQKL
jgi:hypothetical protein